MVVAPALGGVLVAHEVARAFGVRGLFTERQDGAMVLRRGFALEPGERVVVVEDVITTGGSTREVMDAVRGLGGVGRGGRLPDRPQRRRSTWACRSAAWCSLDVPTYRADACPLCAGGSAAGEARLPRAALTGRVPLYRVTLAYDGTEFLGWQAQERPDGTRPRTVQGELEAALDAARERRARAGVGGGTHRRRRPRARAGGVVRAAARDRAGTSCSARSTAC